MKPNRDFHFVDFKESFIHIHLTNIHLSLAHINSPVLGAVGKLWDVQNLCFWVVFSVAEGVARREAYLSSVEISISGKEPFQELLQNNLRSSIEQYRS